MRRQVAASTDSSDNVNRRPIEASLRPSRLSTTIRRRSIATFGWRTPSSASRASKRRLVSASRRSATRGCGPPSPEAAVTGAHLRCHYRLSASLIICRQPLRSDRHVWGADHGSTAHRGCGPARRATAWSGGAPDRAAPCPTRGRCSRRRGSDSGGEFYGPLAGR